MTNHQVNDEFEQKIKALEGELKEYRESWKNLTIAERGELLSRRVEESTVNRIQKHFSIFGAILAILAAGGLFAFGKYIEISLSDSISHNVNAAAQKEVQQISRSVSQQVELELNKIHTLLKGIENEVQNTQKRADRTKLETEIQLRNTLEQVEYMAKLLIKDVERHRQETVYELKQETRKFEDARKEVEKHSNEVLGKIRTELLNLEKLTTVIRAPLSKKIEILKTLQLDRSADDSDIQRYMAILVLKEMEDSELVRRENVLEQARQVISDMFAKNSLQEEFFAEVRFRILRVVGELRFLDVALKNVMERDCLERGNLILLIGALGEPKAVDSLCKIIRSKNENTQIREFAIRSLAAIVQESTTKGFRKFLSSWGVEGGLPIHLEIADMYPQAATGFFRSSKFRDPEIEAMRPVGRGIVKHPGRMTDAQFNSVMETIASILSNKNEASVLRKVSLRALTQISDDKAAGVVKDILFNEWRDYGEYAIDFFIELRNEKSISVLQEFILKTGAENSLKLSCLSALGKVRQDYSIKALREISQKAKDEQISVTARKIADKLEKDMDEMRKLTK